jgi:hypothetical protein
MIASGQAPHRATPDGGAFELELLEGLPCGCVVAIHSVKPSRALVVSIEAKGPHCHFQAHRANKVMRLGGALDVFGYEDGEDLSA